MKKPAQIVTTEADAGRNAVTVLRRLALAQYRLAGASVAGCMTGAGEKPLHAFRGAMRRLRVLLKLLGKLPGMQDVGTIERRLGRLTAELGPARDHDVLMARLRAFERRAKDGTGRSWQAFKAVQEARLAAYRKEVMRIVASARCRTLLHDTGRLLEVELGPRSRRRQAGDIESFAARRLSRLARRVFTADLPDAPCADEALHDVRKRLRRARYAAEFFGQLMGPHTQRWARKLKRATDALGDWRDIDLALTAVAAADSPRPRRFVKTLKIDRQRAITRSREALRKLHAAGACRALLAELREHR